MDWVDGQYGKRAITTKPMNVAGFDIPTGTLTDGNTVPPGLRWVIPQWGWATLAGLVHDTVPERTWADFTWASVASQEALKNEVSFVFTRVALGLLTLVAIRRIGLRGLITRSIRKEEKT